MKHIVLPLFLMLWIPLHGESLLEQTIKKKLEQLSIKRVIIWGHPLHSHTHSYIHYAFYKAFSSLQIPTYWVDKSLPSNVDLHNSLFITEGQVDKTVPIRKDCLYILHNCTSPRYRKLIQQGNAIILQVYTKDCDDRANTVEQSSCFYTSVHDKTIYMPWATDLLPDEIEKNQQNLAALWQQKQRTVAFIGTIGGGEFGNQEPIQQFVHRASKLGFSFTHSTNVQPAENQQIIARSLLAPAIVGPWQQKQGYIPCRIFKNISYGALGVTNSPKVYALLGPSIIFDMDSERLAKKAIVALKDNNIQQTVQQQMQLVKEKHTYLNRIASLLDFFVTVRQTISTINQ